MNTARSHLLILVDIFVGGCKVEEEGLGPPVKTAGDPSWGILAPVCTG